MPRKTQGNLVFDARPDRIDLRDRPYLPPLVSLPPRFPDEQQLETYLPRYREADLVLDQGKEGACTGFGLAAVINYLMWRRQPETVERVSMRMLYHMARIYDEWEGEDYEGSSCRGAMKGWHRHGVTTDAIWPYSGPNGKVRFVKPQKAWPQDAAKRPLGAYYRIDKNSLSDMQAAIYEVGAIYCSADVHDGWFLESSDTLPVIPKGSKAGGHAFALVGYTAEGFIVQNSWGGDWGFHGFAVLRYEDWVSNGADAWVAVLGAPMQVASPRGRVSATLAEEASGRARWSWYSKERKESFEHKNPRVAPLDESEALEHTVVLGNDGRPLARLLDCEDAAASVEEVSLRRPLDWFENHESGKAVPRIAIYAHGGLNAESASLRRVSIMAPYFRENGIYPLFITWKTGLGESLTGIVEDMVSTRFGGRAGWLDATRAQVAEARDRAIELACESLLIKAVWSQMKQNAEAAGAKSAGLGLLARGLKKLADRVEGLEIHLVGHSAGSLVHGYLLGLFERAKLRAHSLSLFAPACSLAFANVHYARAVGTGTLEKSTIHLDVMTNERELADHVGPYGKSLLYLVSRALESDHKTPLLGMEAALNRSAAAQDQWSPACHGALDTWEAFAQGDVQVRTHGKDRSEISTGQGSIPLAHGSFDNDVEVVTKTLERILGSELSTPIETLKDV